MPERIVLGVRAGFPASSEPPVRIFLGSEPAQHRAELVFVWSIEQARNPSRVYEIHLLKSLSGFQRRGWNTGFDNYRYAVPHYASASGRAIYNDVDQIYLADPAELYDAELGEHGYLAVAADDLSVMLLDCARMAEVWTLEAAQRERDSKLQRRAGGLSGLYGELAPEWNARDGAHVAAGPKLLRYADPRTQPWRPFPERFVYQRDGDQRPWLELERSADEAGFQLFTRERPSGLFEALGPDPPLEHLPHEDLPWFLDELFRTAAPTLRVTIACDPASGMQRGPDGHHEPKRTAAWWAERFDAAAARHPGRRWEVELRTRGRATRHRVGGPLEDGAPPRVWVLADDRPGNTTQSLGLANALGWPYQLKQLQPGLLSSLHNRLLGASRRGVDRHRSDPLEPPWPDLVIAAGRRTAPVALWIREKSAGRTRLVQLGRKGGDHAALFDLVATPAYCRLFPHPKRIELRAPLHRISEAHLAEARERWKERIEAYPAPRIALLAGGSSGQYRMTVDSARRLGEGAAQLAREAGGSVLASTSRRTGEAAAEVIRQALGDLPSWLYRAGDPGENPYLCFLAFADALVVTADSESILAEATSLGKPVYIHPMPVRPSFRLLRLFRELVVRRATAKPTGPPGAGRSRRGLQHLCARLIERGFVRPTRDLDLLHRDLIRRGLAQSLGASAAPPSPAPLRETAEVARRVRAMLGIPGGD